MNIMIDYAVEFAIREVMRFVEINKICSCKLYAEFIQKNNAENIIQFIYSDFS